jgi:large subunit ribosomal protein L18
MDTQAKHTRRKNRVRTKLRVVAAERPRLSVHRTLKNISVQVIDDKQGRTVASASTLDADLRKQIKNGGNAEAAKIVGKAVAERAKKAGVNTVVFDRGGYLYHGRVKALAEAAREAGLSF